jgi:NAD-dependent dihydropyrimidine dehydrogenase PreA subunit
MWQVEVDVDKNKCSGDEECADACPARVFEMIKGKSEPVNMDECLGCGMCIEVCPEGAITVTEI